MNIKKNRNKQKLNELKIIRERLLEYVNQSKVFNLRSLSKSLGRNDAYLQQYIKRGSPSYLPEQERSSLCKILAIDSVAIAILMKCAYLNKLNRPILSY